MGAQALSMNPGKDPGRFEATQEATSQIAIALGRIRLTVG